MKFIAAFLAMLLGYSPVAADQFVIYGRVADLPSTVKIISIEQLSIGLIVVTKATNEGPDSVLGIPSAPVDLDAPSIAVHWTLSLSQDSLIDRDIGSALWSDEGYHPSTVEYDPTGFNKRINSMWYGYVNVQSYPWVLHAGFGWLWFSDAIVENGRVSYWIYSTEYGWLGSPRESFPTVYSDTLGMWITLEQAEYMLLAG